MASSEAPQYTNSSKSIYNIVVAAGRALTVDILAKSQPRRIEPDKLQVSLVKTHLCKEKPSGLEKLEKGH